MGVDFLGILPSLLECLFITNFLIHLYYSYLKFDKIHL